MFLSPRGSNATEVRGDGGSADANFRNLTLMKHGMIFGQSRLKIAVFLDIQRVRR